MSHHSRYRPAIFSQLAHDVPHTAKGECYARTYAPPWRILALTLTDDLGIESITFTVLENGKIGIEAPDEVRIVRAELLGVDERPKLVKMSH